MKPLRGRFFIQIVIIQLSFTFFLTIAMTDTEPTDTPPFDAARLAKAVRQRLQSLQRSGVSSIQTQTGQSVVYINCKINSSTFSNMVYRLANRETLNPP